MWGRNTLLLVHPWILRELFLMQYQFFSVRVTFVMKHHNQLHSGEKRDFFFTYNYTLLFITAGSHGSNSNCEGTWKQKLMQITWGKAAYWLVTHSLLSLLSYEPETTTYNAPINHQLWKCPTDLPTIWSYGGMSSTEFLMSQVTLVCIKLT